MLNSPLPPLSSFCLPLIPTSNPSRGSHHQRYPNPPSPQPPALPGPVTAPLLTAPPPLVASFLLKCRSTSPSPAASPHLKDESPSPATHGDATWALVLRLGSPTSFLLQLHSLPSVPYTPMPSINVYPLNMPSIFSPPGPLPLVPQSKIFSPVICTPEPSCQPELSWSFRVTLSISNMTLFNLPPSPQSLPPNRPLFTIHWRMFVLSFPPERKFPEDRAFRAGSCLHPAPRTGSPQ